MSSTDLQIIGAQKTVTAAGAREPLAIGAAGNVRVRAVSIKALRTNTDNVFVGDATVSSIVGDILAPGERLNIAISAEEWKVGALIDLSKIYLDVAVNGEGVSYSYVRD